MTPWPTALGTLRNVENDTFPAFPAFLVFSVDSGGPSLHLEPVWAGTSKVARMATLRLFASWAPPLEPWPAGWPGWLRTPYSWPPDPDRTVRFWPGLYSRPAYCSFCRNERFSSFLVSLIFPSEKREAALDFRPQYCSNVFQMSVFLDGFY